MSVSARRPHAPLRVLWIMCHAPKEVSASGVLGPHNVNSGYTSFGHDKHIVVYRKEEAAKVLVHEMVHWWEYDDELFNDRADHAVSSCLPNCSLKYHIRSAVTVRPREAVTDTVAILVYTAFHIMDKGTAAAAFAGAYTKALAVQRRHILYQASKVLHLQGFRSMKELYNRTFIEESHVFSYYVIKAAMMYDLAKLMPVLKKRSSDATAAYMGASLADPGFVAAIDHCLVTCSWKGAEFKTMRMSRF